VLQANTSYWLVLTVPPNEEFVLWNYGSSNYTSALGVTIPAQRASFYREKGQNYYFALDEGPQELRVTGFAATPAAPVPTGSSRARHTAELARTTSISRSPAPSASSVAAAGRTWSISSCSPSPRPSQSRALP
jgi:hypothetical protein